MSKRRISKRDTVLRKHVVKIRPGGFDIHVDAPPLSSNDSESPDAPEPRPTESDDGPEPRKPRS